MTAGPPAERTKLLAGRYQLGSVIGQGGMALVREAHDRRLDRPVAVKLLRPELAHEPALRRRFESEAQLAAKLAHPNVVWVHDTGEDEATAFIVMERLSGRTLHDEMMAGPLPASIVQQVAVQMLAALAAAHQEGIVHRDIKPGNILAGLTGEWKLADFGIAKAAELPGGDHTGTGLVIGTAAYLAPERFFGAEATPASDLYGLGVVLYEALAGGKPFDAKTSHGAPVLPAAPPVPIATLRPDVDRRLAEAIGRCLAPEPDQRFASATEMLASLGGPASWGDVSPAAPPGPAQPASGPLPPAPSDSPPTVDFGPAQRPAQTAVLPTPPIDYQPSRSWATTAIGPLWRLPRRTGAAAAAVLVVIALIVLVATASHGTSSSRSPATPTSAVTVPTSAVTVPAAGSLPSGLDHALRRLENQVRH